MSPTEHIIVSGLVIYFASVFYARLAGLRSYSKMTTSDFAMTVAIGSMIATTTLTQSISAWKGALGMGVVFLTQFVFSRLRIGGWGVSRWLENTPMLLMKEGEFLRDNMKKCRVREQDILSKLREANVARLDQAYAVVFETTGDVSILHSSESYDDILLKDVKS